MKGGAACHITSDEALALYASLEDADKKKIITLCTELIAGNKPSDEKAQDTYCGTAPE